MKEGDTILKWGSDGGFSDVISSAGKHDWACCLIEGFGTFSFSVSFCL